MAEPAADWYPDPHGRHEYRYWDGSTWTEHVADAGQAATDPAEQAPPPGGDGTPTQPAAETVASGDFGGLRGDLVDGSFTERDRSEQVYLQNSKMLKVEMGPEVLARQGSMVAFQGDIDFSYEGSGSLTKMFKKAVTGEGVPLMRCRGSGELFLADEAKDVHLLWLEGGGLTVNGANLLAMDASLSWDIERVKGVGAIAAGTFNTVLRGHGWAAITTTGTPVVLDTATAPTYADVDAVVAWTSNLRTAINATFKVTSLIGRGSGEVAQMSFSGDGFVIVQPSENHPVRPQQE